MGTATAPRSRHPKNATIHSGRVFAPQQDGVAFADATKFQFARHAIRLLRDLRVRPGFHAIAAPITHGDFISARRVVRDEI